MNSRQLLHPLTYSLQIFTDTSREDRVVHLKDLTARGTWSVPDSKSHTNFLKTLFLAVKEFKDISGQTVLIPMATTAVVACIHKQGCGVRNLCMPYFLRILCLFTRMEVTLTHSTYHTRIWKITMSVGGYYSHNHQETRIL